MATKVFDSAQKRIMAALVIAYSSAYVCRTNISMMLPGIMEELQLSQARAGMLATLFAVIYAVGQIVNGLIVDRVNPRYWIFSGLTISALCNLACAFVPNFNMMLGIWAINACAQSMLWTPVVKIMSLRFEGPAQAKASFFISFSLIFGNLAAWAAAGALVAAASWRMAFVGSAVITGSIGVITFLMLKGVRREEPVQKTAAAGAPAAQKQNLKALIWGTGLAMVLFSCLFNGFVRDSIMTWAPTILKETQGIDLDSVIGVVLIIPIVNFFGVLLGRWVYNRVGHRSRLTISLLTAGCFGFSLLLAMLFRVHVLVCTALLACCVALAYGMNPILTSIVPLEYGKLKCVGTVAGLVDAFIYLGSGLSGVLTGALAENAGWQIVFIIWAVGSLIGSAAMYFASRPRFMKTLDPKK